MIVLKEFKAFALKGNVMDLAIAVIIGAAFGKIVTSLVNDLLMPLIGLLLGGLNFSGLQYTLGDAVLKYGVFIQTVIDFVIIAFSIFMFIRLLSKFKRKEEIQPTVVPEPTKEEILLTEIRDLLKQQRGLDK
ncbi:large conductance mechanosensitive channel protein MscL [Paenibacillus crassostreae]|uniref:Large-conductance mechanosensitive channel n=1 Tax=Paenibacillus crassostreae TaxID=1763538 RepID=A0A167AP70_9BACL|nr:large conductance mechanosensitive channel protein MscL [Paenibacillus crassostreae]AOZ93735.1 mechanosensitive ion channel protein MscL [Paenibacillus crassostreae]OAB71270.1 mechanosensitive ion channel protein MscL [Paenibacillus crassostreae]